MLPRSAGGIDLTDAAAQQILDLDLTWDEISEQMLNGSRVVAPSKREDVRCVLLPDLSVLLSIEGTVLGVARREREEQQESRPQTVTACRVQRRGKRGGVGRRVPTTYRDLEARLRELGYDIVQGGSHRRVEHHGLLITTLPSTPSDTTRGLLNAISTLRRAGIDIRRH